MKVVNILCEHPSISSQHCVIQFRKMRRQLDDQSFIEEIKPYLMDLDSRNGTRLNESKIESAKYYELFEKDIIRLGNS